MPDDPLAPYRRGPQPSPADQAQQPLTEHEALRLAITALNEVPNSRVRMEGYVSTYTLIPDLEKAYRAEEERARLEEAAPKGEATQNSKHTPGPWVLQIADTHINIVGHNGEVVLTGALALKRANLDLIARSPELVEENEQLKAVNAELLGALKELVESVPDYINQANKQVDVDFDVDAELYKARAAIAKAQPEQQPVSRREDTPRSIPSMTDAEIDAAAAHDFQLWEETHQAAREEERAASRQDELNRKLTALYPTIRHTLDLCEEALTELGRSNDGTPSIQALSHLQVIKKELGLLLQPERENNLPAANSPGKTAERGFTLLDEAREARTREIDIEEPER